MDRIIADELPPYYSLKGNWKIGNFAYRSKYLSIYDKSVCFRWNGEYNTPSAHFREFAKNLQFGKKNPPDYLTYPYYAKPCKIPNGVYLDIHRAYSQIASVIGAEAQFKEGKWFEYGITRFTNELFDNKTLRGLIVSATSEKGQVTTWNSEKDELVQSKFHNELYAPHLRLGIMHILHAIASSLMPYIVYWHTDGMIIPFHFLPKVEDILSSWGLETTVKASGLTEIKTTGCYRIGTHKTSQFQMFKPRYQKYINEQNWRWYRSKYVTGMELSSDLIDAELL